MKIYFDGESERVVVEALGGDFAPLSLQLINDGQYWVVQRSTQRRKVGPIIMADVTDQVDASPADPLAYLTEVFTTKGTGVDTPTDISAAIAALDASIQ